MASGHTSCVNLGGMKAAALVLALAVLLGLASRRFLTTKDRYLAWRATRIVTRTARSMFWNHAKVSLALLTCIVVLLVFWLQ